MKSRRSIAFVRASDARHESQEEIDPQELETLEHLLSADSSAYDHVRAEISQKKLLELETQMLGMERAG